MSGSYDVQDGIAIVTMDTPPVNSLGIGNRRFIAQAIGRAEDDPAVRAIVLTGRARAFCGGADIRRCASTSTSATALATMATPISRALG